MEHRASPRTHTDLLVEIITPRDERTAGRIKNLSLLGVFISSNPEPYRLYQSLTVLVHLADAVYTLKGQIVRKQENGIALELEASAASYHQSSGLLRAVKQEMPDNVSMSERIANQ